MGDGAFPVIPAQEGIQKNIVPDQYENRYNLQDWGKPDINLPRLGNTPGDVTLGDSEPFGATFPNFLETKVSDNLHLNMTTISLEKEEIVQGQPTTVNQKQSTNNSQPF
jgi:hypothetical protein